MNPFQTACGATGPLVMKVEAPGDSALEAHAFDQPFLLIGREPGCDLRLDHPEVSDRHAYLQLVGGRLVCLDLGSRSGIFQGGRRGRVIDIDRTRPVRIGPYRIRLAEGDDPTAGPMASLPAEASTITLELSHRALRQSRAELVPGLTLVGSGDCPVRLVDPSVSTYHASLVRTPTGLWVVDLLSETGIRVNGDACRVAQLHPGDTVRLGHSTMRWVESAPDRRPSATPSSKPQAEPATPKPVRPPTPRVAVSLSVMEAAPGGPTVARTIPAASEPRAEPLPAAPPAVSASQALAPSSGTVSSEPIAVEQAAEIVERVLTPLVNQVGLIQQQMISEFHRAREEMLGNFAALYEEQCNAMRNEVENLQRLGGELETLRADLERQSRALGDRLATPASPLAPSGMSVQIVPSASNGGPQARLGSAANAGPRPPAMPTTPPPAPVSASEIKMPRIRVNGSDPVGTRPTVLVTSSPGLPVGSSTSAAMVVPTREARPIAADEPVDSGSTTPLNGFAPVPSVSIPTPAPGTTPNDDVHARLCDRISQIQDEQQSRWRRVFGLFGQNPGNRSTP